MTQFDLKKVLGYSRNATLTFSDFVNAFLDNPREYMHTSSTLLSLAIRHYGYQIVVRSGEPVISYKIFKDLFNDGTNAVFGQESAIKHLVDAIDAAGREAGPNRGLVLVGPPASGKTNIIDLMTHALEEYSKEKTLKLYSFFFEFKNEEATRTLELWNSFKHHPLLLFPLALSRRHETTRPRKAILDEAMARHERLVIPTYYHTGVIDKCSLDILEALLQNPINKGKDLFDIIEEYVRVEEVVFSSAQGQGISNIDDMRHLRARQKRFDFSSADKAILNRHLPGNEIAQYEGSIVASNRGVLHIHDGFSSTDSNREPDYKPLLMLLGSGKVAIESTQASVDTTVMMTTNLEEMDALEKHLTSSKLLDRIEKVTVNYLLDANSEMDILQRDMKIMKEDYEVDPNLLRIAAYYAVMTRLLPPRRKKWPENWSEAKKNLYRDISVEKKLFIYAYRAEDPLETIRRLPNWHPFHNQAHKLKLDLSDQPSLSKRIEEHPKSVTLQESGLFTPEQLALIDDEFMRALWREHYPYEGRCGISVRQLQNIMRNTIAHSDGQKVHVGTFLSQLRRMVAEGPQIHHWLNRDKADSREKHQVLGRNIGAYRLQTDEGGYGDFAGLVKVVKFLYYRIIEREITESTVDRDPQTIEADLRRYLQYTLLANALENKAFAHIMVPRFSFMHPTTGEKVEQPDLHFMASIERVVAPNRDPGSYRREVAHKFLEMQTSGDILLEDDKNVINSRRDNVIICFNDMYAAMLSHRRKVEGINAELLRDAFFAHANNRGLYDGYSVEIRNLVQTILKNMESRFEYPPSIALDTIVFALRKGIVNFTKMIG